MPSTRVRRFALIGCLLLPAAAGAQSSAPVELLVRVCDGVEEVTADCRIAVYTADSREAPLMPERRPGGHHVEVAPGLYDLQITRSDTGDQVAIEWAEHLSVLRYPDEGGHHAEIVNLQPFFGALLVRPPRAWLDTDGDWHVSAFLHGGIGRAGFEPVSGGGDHWLFILPAGRYDLVAGQGSTELAVADLEVPARRTRLKLLELR